MNDAWMAGLIEGEGCFTLREEQWVVITVVSTDLDVLQRLQEVAGTGHLHGPVIVKDKEHWKPRWNWRIGNRIDVRDILLRIRPYMLSRRLAKLDKCLAVLEKTMNTRKLPIGVYESKDSHKYRAQYKNIHLGMFGTVEEAKVAYEKARRED